ncbi:MAG: hypothetical protein AB7V46_10560 [Thermomicrobiales bacterium]
MNTFNLYMDEMPDDIEGDEDSYSDVIFRLVPASEDDADPEDAVLAGLDIYDLLDLRNSIQEVIDVFATASLDPAFVEQLEQGQEDAG